MRSFVVLATVVLLPLLLPSQAWAECPDGKSEVVVITRNGISKTICVDDHAIPGIEQAAENAPLELVPGFDCLSATPIDSLTMIWDGGGTIDVVAWKGSPGSTMLASLTGVSTGDEVTVSGFAGSPSNVFWELFQSEGSKLGESVFNLSCADEDMNDGGDCGKRQGDGKDNDTQYINDWLFEGMAGNDQTLDCTP